MRQSDLGEGFLLNTYNHEFSGRVLDPHHHL
jgi:hypothetical protein